MQRIIKITLLMVIVAGIALASCSSSKKGQCGCPAKNGYVGY